MDCGSNALQGPIALQHTIQSRRSHAVPQMDDRDALRAEYSDDLDDGDIVVVDCSALDVNGLNGKIIVACNRKTGLTLSRFLVMKGMQVLESENRGYKPISMGRDRTWRIIGKVLWWIRKSR
jgi:SOS-response transcriptional repressor LexA